MKPAMRRVALIYNPVSGQHSARRQTAVQAARAVFLQAGVAAELFFTHDAGSATVYAQRAVREGYDAVLACGGDGTVHEVAQSLVGTDVALGVIPLGTANALAANLGLIASPPRVARMLLDASPERISVGRIHYRDKDGNPAARYFVVAAGVGADAVMMGQLDARLKRRFGYILYLIQAFRVWATSSFPLFEAVLPAGGNRDRRTIKVSQLLAVRVRSFGGLLGSFAPGASLQNSDLRLLAFKTQHRLHYLKFVLRAMARRHNFNGAVELLETPWIECHPLDGSREKLFVEADGDVLGSLPARIEAVPESLTLLVPPHVQL